VNYRIVWHVAVQEVPKLRAFVEGLLADEAGTAPKRDEPESEDA
jgi:hypothetical protein